MEASDRRRTRRVDVALFNVLVDRFAVRIEFKLLLVVSDEFDRESLIPIRFRIASAPPFEEEELLNDWYKMLCLHPLMKLRQFLYILR